MMTIEKHRDGFMASCDFCSDTEEAEDSTFDETVTFIQAMGWQVLTEAGETKNKCPCCAGTA